MSTRLSIEQQVVRRLGGHTGDISSGTSTAAVLAGLLDISGDDNWGVGKQLVMPDAATAADQSRGVTSWDDSAGKATFATRSDTNFSNETYMLIQRGDPVKSRMDAALNDRLDQTHRTVVSIVPTIDDVRFYSLGRFPWITTRADIDHIFYRSSPNVIDNSNFDNWRNGPAGSPTGWTATTATIARNNFTTAPARITRGHFSLSLTGSGATGTLDQYLPPELVIQLRGEPLTVEADVLAGATTAVLTITDTAGSTTDAHTGGGDTERLTVTRTIDSSADSIRIRIQEANGVTSHWDNVIAEEASAITNSLSDTGDTSWKLIDTRTEVRDIGGVPVIEVPSPRGRKAQFVVWSRQNFPSLTGDAIVTDCPDDVIVPGLMYELARTMTRGEDRERWEVIMARAAREYAKAAGKLIQRPVPNAQNPVVVRGA